MNTDNARRAGYDIFKVADVEALRSMVEEARQVLSMVDTNNRIAAGENKTAFNRARKAWDGAFVVREVRRVLTLLTPNAKTQRRA